MSESFTGCGAGSGADLTGPGCPTWMLETSGRPPGRLVANPAVCVSPVGRAEGRHLRAGADVRNRGARKVGRASRCRSRHRWTMDPAARVDAILDPLSGESIVSNHRLFGPKFTGVLYDLLVVRTGNIPLNTAAFARAQGREITLNRRPIDNDLWLKSP